MNIFLDILRWTKLVHLILMWKIILWSLGTKKITLYDKSLIKKEKYKGPHDEDLERNLVAIHTNTSNENSMVESGERHIEAHEENP